MTNMTVEQMAKIVYDAIDDFYFVYIIVII